MTAQEQSLMESIQRLEEVLAMPASVTVRDSAIKRFELTFELTWKSLQKRLNKDGLLCRSPRETLRTSFQAGLLEEDENWLRMLEDRNMSVHTYNESLATEIYDRLPQYLELFRVLIKTIEDS